MIKDRYQLMMDTQKNFYEDRPVMKEHNSNPVALIKLLADEVNELQEAIVENDVENIPREIADIFLFTMALATIYGVDIFLEVMEKMMRNYLKYPAINFRGHLNYDEARSVSKESWKNQNGEDWFYED